MNNKDFITKVPPALLRALREAKSFAVVGHVKPDADAVCSSLALVSLLRRIRPGRRIVLANASPVPEQLYFLPQWRSIAAPAKQGILKGLDCAIYLECVKPERTGGIAEPGDFRLTINIDHHKTGRGFADINWVNPRASSNSEQVYILYRALGFVPDRLEATWLYAGIISDTGRFQYALTSPFTHQVAGELLEAGIHHTRIAERLFAVKTREHLCLLGKALATLRYPLAGRAAVFHLDLEDFGNFDYHATQTEDIVNYGLAPDGVEVAFLVKKEPFRGKDVISVSLRSKGKVDVSLLAKSFGGGGHKTAAGCEIEGMAIAQVEKALLDKASVFLPKK
ncbi:MAG: bifunctional oligoribonuclease/PAP phosphatase NrnA [Elusimicrobia bacterium]|nr:bifunctional oligoribonuclease/PAP phosphatase NrnA [Elusimicrobiota bacterium]